MRKARRTTAAMDKPIRAPILKRQINKKINNATGLNQTTTCYLKTAYKILRHQITAVKATNSCDKYAALKSSN